MTFLVLVFLLQILKKLKDQTFREANKLYFIPRNHQD